MCRCPVEAAFIIPSVQLSVILVLNMNTTNEVNGLLRFSIIAFAVASPTPDEYIDVTS